MTRPPRPLLRLPTLAAAALAIALAPASHAANPRPRPARHQPAAKPPQPTRPEPAPTPTEAPGEPVLQRGNRMELDARVVRGETARSGAVYLFQRAPRRLAPLVGLQQSYLDDIVTPVLGPDALEPEPSVAPPAPTPTAPPPNGGM